jgi:segregation and condensation protein B
MSNQLPPLKHILEAALLAAGEPLTLEKLAQLFDEPSPSREALQNALDELAADSATRGLELREVGSGFRLQVRGDFAPWISRLWQEKPARYSRALLETLALIAYKQPISRGEIEDIRGVAVSSHIIKTLLEREWVRIVGYREVPGRPALYATTKQFLDYFTLRSLDDLPPLAEVRNLDEAATTLDEMLEVGLVTMRTERDDGDASTAEAVSAMEATRAVATPSQPQPLESAERDGADSGWDSTTSFAQPEALTEDLASELIAKQAENCSPGQAGGGDGIPEAPQEEDEEGSRSSAVVRSLWSDERTSDPDSEDDNLSDDLLPPRSARG